MRKFLSSTAGATFHADTPNLTFCVRKDSIEVIGKLRPGVYAIAHLLRVTDEQGILFADWGTYFDRIKNYPSSERRAKFNLSYAESREIVNKVNPTVQLPQIKKCCPMRSTE